MRKTRERAPAHLRTAPYEQSPKRISPASTYAQREQSSAYTLDGLPLSGTITLVACPFISATNLSAVGSMMGNDP